MQPASMLRRFLAVLIDFFVLYVTWIGVGLIVVTAKYPQFSGAGIVVYLVAIDLPLTALFGLSPGRAVTGIRALRVSDGQPPGWVRAAVRIFLVATTGAIGVVYWSLVLEWRHLSGSSAGPSRLWWDAAAGTALVRPKGRMEIYSALTETGRSV